MSFFYPFPTQAGQEGAPDNGERMGLQWTLEVFANDGDEQNAGGDATQTDAAAPQPSDNTPAPPSEAAPALVPGTGGEGGAGQQAQAPSQEEQPGVNAQPRPQNQSRSIFLIVGPDGRLIPPPGSEQQAGPAPIWPFFPFGFSNAPPPPDPAKAAELIASLPTVGRALLRRVDKVVAAEDASEGKEQDERGWRCGICLEGMAGPEEIVADPQLVVKALPCNHLFHEGCVQPWFTSHHTW